MNYIIYDGPSLLNGNPVVAILTGVHLPSQNAKTGPVAQLHFLHKTVNPITAVKSKDDEAICGDCPLKPSNNNLCYVNLVKSINNIWTDYIANGDDPKKYSRKNPPTYATRFKMLRLGAYGDPACIPFDVLEALIGRFRAAVGYSHLWRDCDQRLKTLCMASVESLSAAKEAQAMGWRTFRIQNEGEFRVTGEALCAYESANLQCNDCGVCSGTGGTGKGNIVVTVHGPPHKIKNFRRLHGPSE